MENCSIDTSAIGYTALVIYFIVGFGIYKYWDNHPLEEEKSKRITAWILGIIWILIAANGFLKEAAAAYLC